MAYLAFVSDSNSQLIQINPPIIAASPCSLLFPPPSFQHKSLSFDRMDAYDRMVTTWILK